MIYLKLDECKDGKIYLVWDGAHWTAARYQSNGDYGAGWYPMCQGDILGDMRSSQFGISEDKVKYIMEMLSHPEAD